MVCIYHILFFYSTDDGNLGYLHHLAIVNNTAMNIYVQLIVRIPILNFRYIYI